MSLCLKSCLPQTSLLRVLKILPLKCCIPQIFQVALKSFAKSSNIFFNFEANCRLLSTVYYNVVYLAKDLATLHRELFSRLPAQTSRFFLFNINVVQYQRCPTGCQLKIATSHVQYSLDTLKAQCVIFFIISLIALHYRIHCTVVVIVTWYLHNMYIYTIVHVF